MSKYNYYKHNIQDYNKSLNKIMVLGLTGMAALGASMLVVESNKVSASMLTKANKLFKLPINTTTILKSPAFKPSKPSKPTIPLLSRQSNLKYPATSESLMTSFKKYQLTSNQITSTKNKPLTIIPTGNNANILTPKK